MIPLSRSVLGQEENDAVARVLASGRLVQGERVAEFEQRVASRVGRKHAIAVSSGTAALRLALEALAVERGDDVLVPDLTWPSPGHAVMEVGAHPVLVDVDPREWNARPEAMAEARTARTRIAIAIDQFGCPSRSEAIARALPGVKLIVDAACSLGSHIGAHACGALGVIACLSFHPRKLVSTGEGGMCLTDDDALAARLRELRNHGQSAPGKFARASGNHRLSEIAAAIGIVQLGRLDGMLRERARLAAAYGGALAEFDLQRAPEDATRNHQTFGLLLPASHDRDSVVERLRALGVETARLSYALHTLPQFTGVNASQRGFPNASAIADRGLALPLWPGLSDDDQRKVIDALRAVLA
ncbi:MAG TPA: aminotransferase class I/II-fold pyridoxal phosphate-dependent enzyme [Polyangiales bacterium]|nr:aminotransferase class I/II-fold pyridoxal phosphate-dependent enzyme [Polyangiales bacterium]